MSQKSVISYLLVVICYLLSVIENYFADGIVAHPRLYPLALYRLHPSHETALPRQLAEDPDRRVLKTANSLYISVLFTIFATY